jgi:hypothetical protein
MRDKNPLPPAIGDVFKGPRVGLHSKAGTYHVRAIVDNEGEDPEYGWMYQVVFRFWSPRKGWRYEIVDASALGVGLYKKMRSKRKAA